jgi:hypothetical protein
MRLCRAADLAFLMCLHDLLQNAVPCRDARYKSRTEEVKKGKGKTCSTFGGK